MAHRLHDAQKQLQAIKGRRAAARAQARVVARKNRARELTLGLLVDDKSAGNEDANFDFDTEYVIFRALKAFFCLI